MSIYPANVQEKDGGVILRAVIQRLARPALENAKYLCSVKNYFVFLVCI